MLIIHLFEECHTYFFRAMNSKTAKSELIIKKIYFIFVNILFFLGVYKESLVVVNKIYVTLLVIKKLMQFSLEYINP